MVLELGIHLRDYGVIAPGNCNNPELLAILGCKLAEFQHVHTKDRGVFLKLEYSYLQLSSRKVHGVGRCGPFQQFGYFSGGNLLWIEQKVYSHFSEKELVFVGEVLLVVDTGRNLLAAKFLGKHCAYYVHIL